MERRVLGNSKEPTCEKCRREKKKSLNRQLCDLVKRHGLVEVDGKEILGWYMLLPAEDRRFIKGELRDYSSETRSSFMESSQSQEDNSGISYTQGYRDTMLRSSRHTDVDSHCDTLRFDVADDFRKGGYSPENEILGTRDAKSLHLEIWDSSTAREHRSVCDNEDSKDSLTPEDPENQETAQDLQYVTSCLVGSTREPCLDKQLAETKEFSKSDLSYMKPKAGKNFQENKSWPKSFSDVADYPIDSDSSSLDDETFFSVKTGSFYSRSSSQFSLDDGTDVKQCDFEEALEDLSCFSFNRESPYVEDLSPVWDPTSEIKNVKRTTHEQICNVEKFSLYGKAKQRNVSCNTDHSWMSYSDKETQTNQRYSQDCGVNTDPVESGLFSQTQAAANKGVGIAKNVEESMGGGTSVSLEDLVQRAVKAELQLVDVQRWLCWQMCWKTQQQTIEKQSLFSLSKEPNKPSSSVTDFSISSALAEVEKKYQEMKAKIQSGTPLDRLTPLTMQLTTVETSADDFPKDLIGRQNVSDVPAEDLHKSKYMENDPKAAFLSSPDKCDQKPNEIQATPHGSEKPSHYYVHVGNIAHSVKEAGLRDVFQKYHVSNIFLEESSLSCCYAVLTFCKSEDVQAAIREVDGKMMHGKKLKVRAIKTSNCNLSLAFQNIKSVNKETTPDGKGYDSVGPKQSVMPVPPNSESTHPSQAWSAGTHAATVAGNWTNVNIPSSKCYTPTNTNQGIPAAPSCKSSNSSNFMAGGYQYMMQSHHSHMISYNSMPSYMCLPYSYPLYTLPNPPLYQSSVTYPNIIAPGINTNSNLYTQFSKDGGNIARAQPVKNIYRTDHQSKSGISRSLHNKVTSSNGNPKLSEKDTLAKFMEGKIPTLKCVNAPTFSFATSSNAKPVASENASLKVSVTTSQNDKPSASLLPTPETLAKQDRFSEPSPIKPTAPLRFPVFVPPSVTIPEANKPSENPNPSSEFVTPSENKTDTSSSATSRQNDSPGIMDWGVYPQLTSSEGPITVIPNKLNFSQFKRVMKFLMEKHKNATREQIVRALEDVRKTTGGSFGCMTIPEIIFATSTTLAGNIPPA